MKTGKCCNHVTTRCRYSVIDKHRINRTLKYIGFLVRIYAFEPLYLRLCLINYNGNISYLIVVNCATMKLWHGASVSLTNATAFTPRRRRDDRPAGMVVDPGNGDIYVSDGYGNRRVVVFDKSGKFLRQWGRQATDEETQNNVPGVFSEVVHCIAMSNAGLIYVCDRQGNRVQVFQKDGTFVREYPVLRDTTGPGVTGSTVFWPDKAQTYWFTSDDPNGQIHVIRRSDGAVVGNFGRVGRGPGEFENLHNIAIDSKGNIYTAEVQGQRIQRFLYKGGLPRIN